MVSAYDEGARDRNVGLWLEDGRLVNGEGWKDLCGGESGEEQGASGTMVIYKAENVLFASENITTIFPISAFPLMKGCPFHQ